MLAGTPVRSLGSGAGVIVLVGAEMIALEAAGTAVLVGAGTIALEAAGLLTC